MPSVCTPPVPIASGTTELLEREPPAFGPFPLYSHSSQARHWSFSPGQLAEIRSKTNANAQAALQQIVHSSRNDKEAPVLSVDEELSIVRFYLLRIGPITKRLGLPPVVEATAISLMKRYYLHNSCMFFHPKMIMFMSVYLAAKAENYPIQLSRFCAQVNSLSKPKGEEGGKGDTDEGVIAELEFGMVQSLNFELTVHSAHRALFGFILDIQTLDKKLSRDQITSFAAAVQQFLHVARLTDAEFTYAPAHIALASCWCVSGELNGADLVRAWLDGKEKIALPLHKDERNERNDWREKKKIVVTERKKAEEAQAKDSGKAKKQEPAQEPPPAPVVEHSDTEISQAPLGISRGELEGMLSSLSDTIKSFAEPAALAKGQAKPFIDIEVAKRADLRLKECQTLIREHADAGNSREKKRANMGDGNADSKRARIDSDDEL